MAALLIGYAGNDHVSIEPTQHEWPDSLDYWDGNWIFAEVRVRAGGFRGAYRAQLRTDEFARFRAGLSSLYERLTGEATFDSTEEWLRLQLVGDGNGHVSVSGEAVDTPGTGNRLTFEFDVDQTDLPRILAGLDSILTEYPVVGTPPT